MSRNKALKDAGHGDLWPGEVATAAGRVLKLYTEGGSNNANDLRQPLAGGAAPLGRNNSLNLGGGAAGKTLGGGLGQSSSVRALAVPADDGADAAHVEVDVFGAEADEMRRELERLGLGAADLRRRARAALVRQAVMGTLYLAFFTICIVIGIGAQDKYVRRAACTSVASSHVLTPACASQCAEDIPGFLVIYGIFGIILQFGQFCMMILTFKVLRAQVEGGPGDTPPAMAAPPALAIPMACTNCGVFALAVFHLVWTIIGTVRHCFPAAALRESYI